MSRASVFRRANTRPRRRKWRDGTASPGGGALARTDLLCAISGTSGTFGTGAYTTGSFAPPSSSLLVVAVAMVENGGANTPLTDLTITDSLGTPLTYSPQVSSSIDEGGSFYTGCRIYTAPVASGTSMTLTLDCGTRSIGFYAVSVVAYTGYDTSTPVGVTGAASETTISGGPPNPAALTLSGAPAANSEVFAGIGIDKDTGGATPGSGWTEGCDTTNTTWGGIHTETRTGSTSTSVDWVDLRPGGGSLFNWAAVAIEIRSAAGGGDSRAQTGRCTGAAAGTAVAVKSGPQTSTVTAAVTAGTAVAARRQATTGAAAASGVSTAVAARRQATTGRAAGVGAGTATAARRQATTGTGVGAAITRAVAGKKTAAVGAAVAAVITVGAGRKVAPATGAGVAAAAARGTAVKVAPTGGRVVAVAASTGVAGAVSSHAATGSTSAVAVASATAVKVAVPAGRAAAAAVTRGTAVKTAAVIGRCTAAAATRGVAVKVAVVSTSTPAVASSRAQVGKRATPVAVGSAVAATGGVAARRAPQTGAAVATATSAVAVGKRVMPVASCVAVALTAIAQTSRPVVGRCHAVAVSWHRHRTTRRPSTGAITRPGAGTITRPYAGVIERP